MKPLVSVVIPVYNRENLIARCLKAIFLQTYENIEIIVVDNASTDRTWDVLKKYEREHLNLKIFRNTQNLGPVKNWKRCVDKANGKYIKIQWSDDWVDKEYLTQTVDVLENDPEIGFVFTPTYIHIDNKTHILYAKIKKNKQKLYKFINYFSCDWLGFPSSPGNALFRAIDVRNNLIIDIPNVLNLDFKNFGAGNDLLLYLMCYPKYKYFYVTNKPLSHFLSHVDSFTASNDLKAYYLLAVKYYVTSILKDKYLIRNFNNALRITNFIHRNKYQKIVDNNYNYSLLILIKISIGKIFCYIYQSIIWHFY